MPQNNLNCIFIAPNKSLCLQRSQELTRSLASFGVRVVEMTGDTPMDFSFDIQAAPSVIITTPEKLDYLSRFWQRYLNILGFLDLLFIDEVHHLNEDRGAILETVIVRLRTLRKVLSTQTTSDFHVNRKCGSMRIIALSATLPNVADIGEWLGCPPEAIHFFDESFRPVPLTVHVHAYPAMNNLFLFERSLDSRVLEMVYKYSDGKQSLVFCASKPNTEKLALHIAQRLDNKFLYTSKSIVPATDQSQIRRSIEGIHDPRLQELVRKRVAYHHAGLPPDDRAAVEQLYLCGHILVLCATTTLAHGVNLPAHLVIIKGTNQWRGGTKGYERMPRSTVLQMVGRAGRPGYDDHGVAVILTSEDDRPHFESVSICADVVESSLQCAIVEVLCAEITQSIVSNVAEALEWLKSTFFYLRVHKNPTRYGFPIVSNEAEMDSLLRETCIKILKDLEKEGIVAFSSHAESSNLHQEKLQTSSEMESQGNLNDFAVRALKPGFYMTKNMIKFQTMTSLMKIPATANIQELLGAVASVDEVSRPVRRSEKKILNELSKTIRFQMKSRVQEPAQKAFVLLQTAVSREHISDFALRVEQSELVDQVQRVLSALIDYAIDNLKGRLLVSALYLSRALKTRLWETESASLFLQCPGISQSTQDRLKEREILNLEAISTKSAYEIKLELNIPDPEFRQLLSFINYCQLYEMELLVATVDSTHKHNSTSLIQFCVRKKANRTSNHPSPPPHFILVSIHEPTSVLVCHRHVSSASVMDTGITFTVPLPDSMNLNDISSRLLCSLVGLDACVLAQSILKSDEPEATKRAPLRKPSERADRKALKVVRDSNRGERMREERDQKIESEVDSPSLVIHKIKPNILQTKPLKHNSELPDMAMFGYHPVNVGSIYKPMIEKLTTKYSPKYHYRNTIDEITSPYSDANTYFAKMDSSDGAEIPEQLAVSLETVFRDADEPPDTASDCLETGRTGHAQSSMSMTSHSPSSNQFMETRYRDRIETNSPPHKRQIPYPYLKPTGLADLMSSPYTNVGFQNNGPITSISDGSSTSRSRNLRHYMGSGNELLILRNKALELSLDSIPVRRLPSKASAKSETENFVTPHHTSPPLLQGLSPDPANKRGLLQEPNVNEGDLFEQYRYFDDTERIQKEGLRENSNHSRINQKRIRSQAFHEINNQQSLFEFQPSDLNMAFSPPSEPFKTNARSSSNHSAEVRLDLNNMQKGNLDRGNGFWRNSTYKKYKSMNDYENTEPRGNNEKVERLVELSSYLGDSEKNDDISVDLFDRGFF